MENKNAEWLSSDAKKIKKAIDENAVVIVSRHGCFLAFTIMRLLIVHGVNLFVSEVSDEVSDEKTLMEELGWVGTDIYEEQVVLPIVLPVLVIGGQLVGGMETIMAVHLKGQMVPKLKEAGALWL